MGKYINKINDKELPATGKADEIVKLLPETKVITQPIGFTENLVCVVSNFSFEAAGYCYDEREFEEFARYDGRQKTWLIVPDAHNYAK